MNLKIFPECFCQSIRIEESMNIYWLKMYIIVKFIWCDLIGLDLIHSKKESTNTEMWSNPIQTAWYQPSFLHTIKTKENTQKHQKHNLMPTPNQNEDLIISGNSLMVHSGFDSKSFKTLKEPHQTIITNRGASTARGDFRSMRCRLEHKQERWPWMEKECMVFTCSLLLKWYSTTYSIIGEIPSEFIGYDH